MSRDDTTQNKLPPLIEELSKIIPPDDEDQPTISNSKSKISDTAKKHGFAVFANRPRIFHE